ncbi:MAG: hypothetical protein ACERKD_15465 [Prolixibacteraceae bacterium]
MNNYRKIIFLFLLGIFCTEYIYSQTTDEKAELETQLESLEGDQLREDKSDKVQEKWFASTRYTKNNGYKKVGKTMLDYIIKQSIVQNQPSLKSVSLVTSNVNPWLPLGPTTMPIAAGSVSSTGSPSGIGLVQSVWADPTITSTIYAGGMNGGLWKKELGGNWENLTDQLYSFGVLDIAVDPGNPQKIYIACGCFVANGGSINNGGYGLGVIFTEDGGNTWKADKMTSLPTEDLFMVKVIIDPNNSNTIYALSKTSVYKSTNGGYNWTNTSPPSSSTTEFIDLVIKPNNSDTIFICAETNEIYRSTNAAASWETTNLANNLSNTGTKTRMGIAASAAEPNSLFSIYTMNNTYATLEKSTDNGDTWNPIATNKKISCGNYTPLRLSISPTNIDNIYVGGIKFYKYDVANIKFVEMASPKLTPLNERLHDDMRDILIVDNGGTDVVYVGHDGGLSRSDDEASTWTAIDDGLQIGLFYSISSCDASPGVLIGGAHDCSSHIYDGGIWYNTSNMFSDGGSALVDDTNEDIMYALYSSYFYRSDTKGVTWNKTLFKKIEYDAPLLQHPTNNQTIYFGELTPKVSFDKGANIQNLTTIGNIGGNGSQRVTNMDICRSNLNVFYFARANYTYTPITFTGSTLYRRSDDGSTWSELTYGIGTILNDVRITGIKIHPTCPDTVWVTVGGLVNGKKIYQTKDGGSSWQNISYNLENFPVQCIDFDEYNRNIYIGTDLGVMYKNIDETVWHDYDDFPHVLVSDLDINKTTGKLYASTFGRGVWVMEIPGLCYSGNTTYINSSTTWYSDRDICDNLTINSGILTIKADVLMSYKSTITIKSGATLTIDAGKIINANIIAESGSNLILKNNAEIEIKRNDKLDINANAVFDFSYGFVNILSN